MNQVLKTVFAAAFSALMASSGIADPASDKGTIIQRFEQWTMAFNAHDAVGACDLFALDLLYSIPEVLQGTHQTMCANFTRLFSSNKLRLHYDRPDIHEILLQGDMAVVRLTWTFRAEANGARDTTTEEGIDVFRRQPDGRWSIARFMAFTTRPNKVLQ
ncbi:hypothetical protein GCM10007874_28860 [Labrys miyagiensis]|uniref:DUF4440 domain-containing protein n=1 Tax=Labrys miyagiensis TaxID=346912 RepID=A0ABQ6CI36_9HYPH|nr:nuclear transport factor 2 family protein [Labrys miyagiensis]GLS19869.1 hypothetical protein GCM10007874_28860 [Labrys miyagiensis]